MDTDPKPGVTPLETIRKIVEPGIECGAIKVNPQEDGSAVLDINYVGEEGPVHATLRTTGDDAALVTGLAELSKSKP